MVDLVRFLALVEGLVLVEALAGLAVGDSRLFL